MNRGLWYQWGGGKCRPYLKKVSTRRMKYLAEKRTVRVRGTLRALGDIAEKGFVFTNNLKVFAEVIGFLKSNQIPYEYIDGGKHWEYAIRRLDIKTGSDEIESIRSAKEGQDS